MPDAPDVPPDGVDLPEACRDVVVTLEVFENLTGRTSVFLGHPDFTPPDVGDMPR